MRVLIAQFKNESNTFNNRIVRTPSYVRFGRDAELALFCTYNELNGFMSAVRQQGAGDVQMSVCAEFPNGGILSDNAFKSIISSVKNDIAAFRPDVILIAMNGATVTESSEDGCGEFLSEARKAAGEECVIGVTLDMHANLTRKMTEMSDLIMSYKTIPHTDLYDTGKRLAELAILFAQKKIKPHTAMVKLPLIIPAEMGSTDSFPMRGVIRKINGIENRQGVYCASAMVVEPWLNISDIGCSVIVIADNEDTAVKYAAEAAEFIWDMRFNAIPEFRSIEYGVKLARRPKDLPILFVDSADSPAGGAHGDSAEVLRGLLEHARGLRCVTNVSDPAAVRLACRLGEGADISVDLGGWAGTRGIDRVHFDGRVKKICGGLFAFKGAVMNGRTINMGLTALVEKDGINVLITENAVDNRDPEMYRSAGIVIEDMDIVSVKSAVGYTVPYLGLYCERVILDTPGIANPRLDKKDYTKLAADVFPLSGSVSFSIDSEKIFRK